MNENNKKKKKPNIWDFLIPNQEIPDDDDKDDDKKKSHKKTISSREFQAFLILLSFEGNKISLLKTYIDEQFKHESRTKGYDYINFLCEKGEKRDMKGKVIEKGMVYKDGKTVHVNKKVRSEYEKFIAPTLSNTKNIVRELFRDNLSAIKDMEKNREKFKNYTETIIGAVNDLISTSFSSALKSKRFQKKIDELIWKYYRAEMLKSEMFSI